MEASQKQLKQDQETRRPSELNLSPLHLSYVVFSQQGRQQPYLIKEHKIKLLSVWTICINCTFLNIKSTN
jgi:hypothetical protein